MKPQNPTSRAGSGAAPRQTLRLWSFVVRRGVISDPHPVLCSEFALHLTGIDGAGQLHQHDLALSARGRPVFHAFGDDKPLARTYDHLSVAKLNRHFSFHNTEHLVRLGLRLPDKITLNLHQLEVVVVLL